MSQRQRGQEITVRVAVDGVLQPGSFFKVTEFTATPRTDIVEEDYLGELESDLDIQHHGWDLAWSIHNQDGRAIDFLETIVGREQNAQAHPEITVTVIYAYRAGLAESRTVVYHNVFMKVNEEGFAGRREYTSTSFEAKAKRRSVMNVA